MLLATRDVAYGQAATLRWDHVRLCRPASVAKTIASILRRSAPALGADKWVAERREWVDHALIGDATLCETPLLPVLLAVLAARRDTAALPMGRAKILAAVVEDVIHRREVGRRPDLQLGRLANSENEAALMDGYAAEAAAILNANGQILFRDLVSAVAIEVGPSWNLHSRPAAVAAEHMIRFWDESGIFVISGAAETVAPRVALFAEIGDAMQAVKRPAELSQWISERIERRQLEPLILAAGLSPLAADELGAAATRAQDRELVHAVVRAQSEGAHVSESTLQEIICSLLLDIKAGGREGLESMRQLVKLAISEEHRPGFCEALTSYSETHKQVALALLDLRLRSPEELRKNPESLLDALSLGRLAELEARVSSSKLDISDLVPDRSYSDAVAGAADVLLGYVDEATDLVVARASEASFGRAQDLVELLRDRGFKEEARAALNDKTGNLSPVPNLMDRFAHHYEKPLLALIAEHPAVRLTYKQRTRLSEIADLLKTLALDDVGSSYMLKEQQHNLPHVIGLVSRLGSFNSEVLAVEAELTIERMNDAEKAAWSGRGVGELAPYYALFDGARRVRLSNWSAVIESDREAALSLLLQMLKWGRPSAVVAALALTNSPLGTRAAPLLRQLIPRVASSTTHQELVAHLLCQFVDGPEPEIWRDSKDPVLRAVFAQRCQVNLADQISPDLIRMLNDDDGEVRTIAIDRLRGIELVDREHVLTHLSTAPEIGWMCRGCRTENPARRGLLGCRKEGCFRAGPNPARRAADLLAESG